MDNFILVARQVAILFVLIGAGVVCRKAKLIDEFSVRGMVNVLLLLVTPAIVVDSFQRPFDPAMLRQLGLAFAIAVSVHLVAIGIALLVARGDERTRPVLRLSMVFSNAGFMGLPLEYAILGSRGVFFGIVYVAVFNVFMWSWGLMQMRGGGMARDLKMFVNPGTVGIAIGLPLFLLSAKLPEIVGTPVHAMANLNTPLAMLVIGYYLAGADLKSLVGHPSVHGAAFVRMIAIPLVVVGLLYPVRGFLDRAMVLAMVIASCAPSAAMVSMFASKYNRDVDMSVGLVSGTTILSILTMPAVIAVAMGVL